MEIVLTGDPITAQRAYEVGLVNRVTAPDALLGEALALARRIAANAPLSVLAGKETVHLATEMGKTAALRAARHAWERAYRSRDAQEGPQAFAEKRAPVWRGE